MQPRLRCSYLQIEHSKAHWSLLADQSGVIEGEEVAEVSNVEEFKALQSHSTWGGFFSTFYGEDENIDDHGELMVGEKFAEGAQPELYDAQVNWWDDEKNERDLNDRREYVLKVFKKGTFLKQLPQGLLHFHVEVMENLQSPSPKVFPRHFCNICRGTLLKASRFVFLMEDICLHTVIECNMKLRSSEDCGPFSKAEVEYINYEVVLGWIGCIVVTLFIRT